MLGVWCKNPFLFFLFPGKRASGSIWDQRVPTMEEPGLKLPMSPPQAPPKGQPDPPPRTPPPHGSRGTCSNIVKFKSDCSTLGLAFLEFLALLSPLSSHLQCFYRYVQHRTGLIRTASHQGGYQTGCGAHAHGTKNGQREQRPHWKQAVNCVLHTWSLCHAHQAENTCSETTD